MRLEVTRRADLAVRAMRLLGDADGRLKAQALAESLCTTPAFVPQVIGPLVKAGWVRSDPGPNGGYSLTVSLGEVSVLDVVEAVDGPTDSGICVVAGDACNADQPCVLHDAWTRARRDLMRGLDAITIASLDSRR
jgi:Rrf2 family protein